MIQKSAIFNKDKSKRFLLTRSWDYNDELSSCVFIMLNPSLADSKTDDPTVKKCIYYSTKFGHNRLSIVNIFPNVSTVPSINKFSFCKNNFHFIKNVLKENQYIYLAWGFNLEIKEWLKPLLKNKSVFVLEMSKHNTPKHPLYLKKDLDPVLINL